MIYVGLTGWGDHPDVYQAGSKNKDKLKDYAGHFPIVELDASFYAVQPQRNTEKWVKDTPDSFSFIVKAYQGMTGHQRGEIPFDSKEEMFSAFVQSLKPFIEHGKLGMVLLQFPPWFDCQKDNVEYIRYCQERLTDLPLAIEFRNQTWYQSEFKEQTLAFLKSNSWIHTVCDEPQAGEGSIPIVPIATNDHSTLVRLHGRNFHGWTKKGNGDKWREVRYLYDYNEQELVEWVNIIKQLEKQSKNVFVVFNNNSGGHAAKNAKQLIRLLDIDYSGLAPRQLDLF
ncbi:DUF72 domain-containing protein [Jeotgalibacillus proteolyticus]|uniref:DUF72 domain-containing protein n=1 Tax=Jeotgalibacillus proteolyticus TaxID=2082395 RepID=A0A2S5GAR7_9BACL|nr:DUF72 domain-containing protein [Jeotgalibacillus proteolyticus]PPA70099.1 DUF72 domain-containing protein [Jeotgalibacillus proteolyticus]